MSEDTHIPAGGPKRAARRFRALRAVAPSALLGSVKRPKGHGVGSKTHLYYDEHGRRLPKEKRNG